MLARKQTILPTRTWAHVRFHTNHAYITAASLPSALTIESSGSPSSTRLTNIYKFSFNTMVHLEDGKQYIIVSEANHQCASYDPGQLPRGWIVLQPRDNAQGYSPLFVAKSVGGGKWRFIVPGWPDLYLGFHGSAPHDDSELKPVSIVQENESAHVEWQVDPTEGPNYEIHMSVGPDHVCWSSPGDDTPGAVVVLKEQNASPGQNWYFGIPVDE
ncbi:hypothetical protein RSOLAG1IB_10780 [Rhizoctonia solani AG-1 IB]|uniref:Ricin B lectin domain-containing protein n=1 Tax=Thanatephorus cucumeris (strain AG1-IB / isolate 7/3/14) TaxID=1108050 RepID=M5BWB5_THACB|nr:hypothetical protein BN14_05579 [Rhizoctonia solani AG-1 IB]CEL63464.1 hypothetical protein RSOLAG1IB_10780 [Rhizoctonia solani AG-1 IB]